MQTRRDGMPDLNGRWRVVHRVESSERSRFVGLSIEFQVNLVEFGGAIVGSGEKFLVDHELTGREERSHLDISGAVRNAEIRLSLLERPDNRPDSILIGEILWRPTGEDQLTGTFWVDAGKTRGSSEAFRWDRADDRSQGPAAAGR
jgi:hypothetical protein